MGAKGLVSSADLPQLQFSSSTVSAWTTYTLVVQPGATVPSTPPVPAFTPGRGSALYRYTAHDFLTGEYRDDLYPQGVTYDKRISEAGAFSGTLPVPNRRVAQAVRRVIPLTRSDLTTGPGRIEIRIWRDGVLAGRYWLHGARVARGRDGKVSVHLRASTLDSYFFSVRVRTSLSYSGNQITNARALLTHAQAQPGANIGLQLQGGTGGGSRALEVKPDSGTSYGRILQEYARTSDGFEYTLIEEVGPDGVTSTWVWGAPKIVSDTVHVFTESPHGGEIDQWSIDIDALRGGTDWDVRGGTPEGDATEDRAPVYSTTKTTAHRAAGWPRIDHLVDHPTQSTDTSTLNAYADYWADRAGGAVWVRSVTVILGRHSSLNMNSLGDLARQVMTNVWHERVDGGAGYDASERIIGIAVTPAEKGVGKDIVQLILESEAT
ncbi:hypothetical protein [Streptosporangium jomthongense]|uniref:Uncharacterized protein n=1 Tax=Streptosporangium jomthongense TaxID=1193683 RepID=A0ABV8EWR4_9ACTN